MKPWLDKVGSLTVAHIPCPDYGTVDLAVPPSGVLHTTEGGWDGSLAVFKQHYAPHFLVGPGRIAQLVALGRMSGALENAAGGVETNRWARVQIETVGYSKEQPYVFDAKTMDTLAALLAALRDEAGIPLTRPFADSMPPLPWSSPAFERRHAGKWGKVAGWYGHVDIPENSHWDPGAFEWSRLLDLAHSGLPAPRKPTVKPAAKPKFKLTIYRKNGEVVAVTSSTPADRLHEALAAGADRVIVERAA